MHLLRLWAASGCSLCLVSAPLVPALGSVSLPILTANRTAAEPAPASNQASFASSGRELLYQGKFSAARAALGQELRQARGDRPRQQILIDTAWVEAYLGQDEAAQVLLDQAALLGAIAPELSAQLDLAQASLLLARGEFPEAETRLNRAQPQISAPRDRLQLELLLGRLHRNLGRYGDALAAAKAALALGGDSIHRASALQLQGDVNWDLHQMAAAEQDYRQALALYRSLGDGLGAGRLWQRLGWIAQEMERWQASEQAYTQALNQALAMDDRLGQMMSRLQLGQVALKQGHLDKAQAILKLAIAQGQPSPTLARLHLLLGQVEVQRGRFDQALAQYAKLADPAQPEGAARTDVVTGMMLQRQRGEVYLLQGELQRAEQEFRGAIAILETIRSRLWDQQKVTLFDANAALYDRLQEALIAQGKIEAALVVSEQSRARAFNELLGQRLSARVTPLGDAPPSAAAVTSLSQIRQIARDQNATLVQYAVIQPLTQNYSETSQASVGAERLFIWVIPPDGAVSFHQQDLDDLGGDFGRLGCQPAAAT